jgi:hypothetical protein
MPENARSEMEGALRQFSQFGCHSLEIDNEMSETLNLDVRDLKLTKRPQNRIAAVE